MSENDEGFRPGLEVAVIGMAGRFPGANNIELFWDNLTNGVHSITFITDEELLEAGVNHQLINNPNYVKAKGLVEGMEYFDAAFFGYTPKDAVLLDPQIRIFHECVWEVLEDAGYDPDTYDGLIGLYGGGAGNIFWEALSMIGDVGKVNNLESGVDILYLNNKDFICTQISYKQNLKGPSSTVYTACSTSLVAIHMACQAILGGECDIALAGGVTISPRKRSGYLYKAGMLYSRDGYCRTFDSRASGTIFTNGAGVVALKRLEEAIADGDNIYAVVKGTAINNDGKRKVGYTAPSAEGQRDVIRAALQVAEVEPESITYLEAHGTGTIMGDPIEIEALKAAYNTDKKNYCRIGALKTNIGHTDAAAGAASFIKTVLSLKHKVIPPSLHFEDPNPKIDFENSPFIVNTELKEWKSTEYPLRAGISSFGIGGTNAHAILEEAPEFAERESIPPPREYQLILISAKTESSLEQMTRNLADHFKKNPGTNLADAAYTLKIGRRVFNHKRMLVCPTNDVNETIEILSSPTSGKLHTAFSNDTKRSIVFLFPGQGSQYINMGLDLYRTEPVFRTEANHCFDILKSLSGYDIKEILYPTHYHYDCLKASPLEKGLHLSRLKAPPIERGLHTDRFTAFPLERVHINRLEAHPLEKGLHTAPAEHRLAGDYSPDQRINQTELTQPIIFIFEYALAKLLIKWGIKPDAMIGHSIGEYTAACLSGLFSLENALKLVAARGKLMQEIPGGAMLSIPLPEEELTPLLNDQLALAAVNAPSLCVVSGTYDAIDTFEVKLKEKGIKSRRLHTSHAFHSKMMDPVLRAFEKSVPHERFGDLNIPYISNVTGDWISAEEAADPTYWSRHLRGTVKFADGIKELLKKQDSILIEVGPGTALSTFAKQQVKNESGQVVLNLIRHPQENVSDVYYILERIGQLWLYGIEPNWNEFYSREKRHRVSLPTYAFDRQRYWLEGDPFKIGIEGASKKQMLQKNPDINEWFYMPSWQRSMLPTGNQGKAQEDTGWLFFMDECGLGTRLTAQMQADDLNAVLVKKGEKFCEVSHKEYIINPGQDKDYEELLNTLNAKGPIPRMIVHLWNVTEKISHQKGFQWAADVQNLGYYSLINLAKAIGKLDTTDEFQVTVVTNHMQEVTGEETLWPEKATLLGPVKVIPREFQSISCRCVDIVYPGIEEWKTRKLIIQLLAEFKANAPDQLIAYRGNYRLVQSFTPLRLDDPGETTPRLKEKGCYLVTGGLGGIGLEIAQYLTKHVHARLVLTGRSEFPSKDTWEEWLHSHPETNTTSVKIRKVQELEEHGAEVIAASADVSNMEQMKEIIQQAEERFGNLNGIIHSAGVPDGAIIKRRTREITESIMAPKVKGTLVLEQILHDLDIEPDFFILCSSVSSILAPFGQVGYVGANAFLDTFAHYKTSQDDIFCVSINWDTWQEVGMAVTAAKKIEKMIDISVSPSGKVAHPFLDRKISSSTGQKIYSGKFSVNKTWVLDEHRIMGKPTVPGTTWLEVARAAFEDHMNADMKQKNLNISEMLFLTPLIVKENEEKEVRVILNKQGSGFDFVVRSRINSTGDEWVNHAKGHMVLVKKESQVIHNIKELEARCSEHEIVVSGEQPGYEEQLAKNPLQFGPRWNNIKRIKSGSHEWLALMELPEAFSNDTQFFKLHPALMDTATSFMAADHKGDESILYLPFCYKGLKVKKPLPGKIYSYIKKMGVNKSQEEIMRFNIHIMDEHGRELVEVEEFNLKKVNSQTYTTKRLRGESAAGTTQPAEVQEDLLKFGILPSEGVEAFRRVMAGQVPQVCVSTRNLIDLVSYTDASGGSLLEMSMEEITPSRPKISRSGLSTPYVAPRNKTEKILAEIWEKFFGITEAGIHDNFFELGGDSLKTMTIEAEIRKKLDIKVPLEEFFTRPTIEGLAQYIDESSSQDIYVEIEPVEKRRYYELSSAQKRLYFLNQLDSGSINYNQPHYLLLEEEIQKDLAEEIFKKLIKRHESLRTSFEMVDGKVMQKIDDNVDFELEYYQSKGTKEDVLKGFIRPFDFSKACQFRVGLIKMGESKYILIIDIHHIIADAFAFGIFTREFEALYRGEELPPLKIQYKDYAEWQNRESVKDALKSQEEYWLKELGGDMPLLRMPVDFPRPPAQSFEGNSIMSEIGSKESGALNTLAIKENATLFMVLLAVYNILLSKLSGQEDIMVGTVIEGRRHEDFRKIFGMFVNTLVLRNHPLENYTFKEFLQNVRRKTLEVFENQDYQFESLVEKVSVNRDTSRNPLFDAAFALQNSDKPQRATESEGFGLKARYSEYEKDTTVFDLSLIAEEIGGNLQLTWTYCTRLFKTSTIKKLATHFKDITYAVLENKNIKLKDIKISHRLLSAKSTGEQMDLGF